MGDYLTSQGEIEEAGSYYRKSLEARERIYERSQTAAVLRGLPISYRNMGNYLTSQGEIEEAGSYYRKFLEAAEQIYKRSQSATALRDLLLAHNDMGDNKYALKLYAEAHFHRTKALELYESYVQLDSSFQEFDSYFRDKLAIVDNND